MNPIKGQSAIVTGGTSGIGRAVALNLARLGVQVAVAGRDPARLDLTARALESESLAAGHGARHVAIRTDIQVAAEADELVRTALAAFGQIDILVAAAGTPGSLALARRIPYTVSQMPDEEWHEVINTNLKGLFWINRAVLCAMVAQGRGQIVNVASYPGAIRGSAGASAYCASKHAVRRLTEALAREAQPFGVRVQAILPGATATPILYGAGGGWMSARGQMTPETVAAFISDMIRLPPDAQLRNPMLVPYSATTPVSPGGEPA
jgi:3-oxoacyl-[acyl-carrier protein] reductase